MAFEYKTTSTLATAAAPSINVKADMTASKAFQALSGMVSDVAKVATDSITAQAKSVQKQNKGDVTLLIGEYRRAYTEASANAGLNSLDQQNLAAQYMKVTDELYTKLDADSQAQLASFYNDNRNAVATSYTNVMKKARKHDFESQFSSTLPAILSQDDNLRASTLAAYANDAQRFGVDPNDFGKMMVNQTVHYRLNNIPDMAAMINSRDYTAVNQMERDMEFMFALDPKLKDKDYTTAAQKKIKEVKNAINTQVVSELKQAISTSSKDMFNGLLLEAVTHGAITRSEGVMYEREFIDKITNNPQAQAAQTMITTEGKPILSSIVDPKERKAVGALLDQQVTSMFATGKVDYGIAKHHATQNSEKYSAIYKNVRNSYIGQVRSITQEPAKTPEEELNKAARIQQAIANVRKHDRYAFGLLTSDDLLKADVMEMLVVGNMGQNIPDVLSVLDSQGGVKLAPKNSGRVEDIYEDLPVDSQAKAHRQYSALVSAGIGEDQAFDMVKDLHTYSSIGDQSFEFSGNATEELIKAGFTMDSLEVFEENLMDSLPAEIMFNVQDVLEGTNAQMTLNKGTLYFKNEEGDTATVLLYPDQMKALSQASNTQWQDENAPKGIEIVADTVARDLSKNLNAFWGALKAEGNYYNEVTEALTAPIVNQPKALVEFFGDQPTIINNMIDTWIQKDASTAWSQYLKDTAKSADTIVEQVAKSNDLEVKEAKEALKEHRKASQELINEVSKGQAAPKSTTNIGKAMEQKSAAIRDVMINNDFTSFINKLVNGEVAQKTTKQEAPSGVLATPSKYNNPGNVEATEGWAGTSGEGYGENGRFASFDTPEMGLRAVARDIRTKMHKGDGDTVRDIISKYAPASDGNPTEKYIKFVEDKVGKQDVTMDDIPAIVAAIVQFENTPDVAAYYLNNPKLLETANELSKYSFSKGTTLEQAKKKAGIK